jgi:5-oxoprolinase (ATP-hydrolysing)
MQELDVSAKQALVEQGYEANSILLEKFLNIRYEGTDNAIIIQESSEMDYGQAFRAQYMRKFGFNLEGRGMLIEDYRVRAVVHGQTPPPQAETPSLGAPESRYNANAYKMDDLKPGHEVEGPAVIVQAISQIVFEIGCRAKVTADGDLDISLESGLEKDPDSEEEVKEDPVQLSIFSHRFMGIAEQMGRTLQRTAISVNMKERLDFSCALFTAGGGLVANAPHIPVHLGAMQAAVTFQVKDWNAKGRDGIKDGEVLVSNHPQLAGGSHLPDITVITPVFHNGEIIFFVASRGHHADIGGIAPGSMPPHSQKLEDE